MRVTDDVGGQAESRRTITVRDGNSVPSISLNSTPGFRTVSAFGYDTDGFVTQYAWDLDGDEAYDDLVSGSAMTATIPDAMTGTFEIGVRVTDDQGGIATARRVVSFIDEAPVPPAVSSFPNQPRVGEMVSFTASVQGGDLRTVEWDLDGDGEWDGPGQQSLYSSRSYDTPGQRTVRLRLTDRQGRTAIGQTMVNISPATGNLLPSVFAYPSPPLPRVGVETRFFEQSFDADGIASRAWDLDGDGAYDDGTAMQATYTFPTAGVHEFGIKVTDTAGGVTEQRRTVAVHEGNIPPRAVISGSLTAKTGEPVSLLAAILVVDENAPLNFAWDTDEDGSFDDGTFQSVNPTFTTPGVKRVRVRVSDPEGLSDTASFVLEVSVPTPNRAPIFELGTMETTIRPGRPASFYASGNDPDGDPVTYTWDMDGDGAFDDGTGTNVTYTWAEAGTYRSRVKASDGKGGEQIELRTVPVVADPGLPPEVYAYLPSVVRSGRPVSLSVSAYDPDGGLAWPPAPLLFEFDLDGDGQFDEQPSGSNGAYTWTFTETVEATCGPRTRAATRPQARSAWSRRRSTPRPRARSSRSAVRSPSGRPSSCGHTATTLMAAPCPTPGISTATRSTTTARHSR